MTLNSRPPVIVLRLHDLTALDFVKTQSEFSPVLLRLRAKSGALLRHINIYIYFFFKGVINYSHVCMKS